MYNSIKVVVGKTNGEKTRFRPQVFGRNLFHGPSHLFLSWSPAFFKDALTIYYAHRKDPNDDTKELVTNEDLDAVEPTLPALTIRKEIVTQDPYAAVKAFLIKRQAFERCLLGWNPNKMPPASTEHGGVYGRLRAWMTVGEVGGRQVFHSMVLLNLMDVPQFLSSPKKC